MFAVDGWLARDGVGRTVPGCAGECLVMERAMAIVQLIGGIAIPRRLSRLLRQEGHRAHTCENLKTFATREPEAGREVGCALVDIDVPENLDELPGFLKYAADHGVAVVVLATRPNPADIIAAMKVGVSDFLIKPVAEQVLSEAVGTALVHARKQRSRASRIAFLKERYGSLTYQERLVALFVSEGHRNRDIAEKLGVAERTVKNYRTLALKKLAVNSVPDLVHAFSLLGMDNPHCGASVQTEAIGQGANRGADATDRSASQATQGGSRCAESPLSGPDG